MNHLSVFKSFLSIYLYSFKDVNNDINSIMYFLFNHCFFYVHNLLPCLLIILCCAAELYIAFIRGCMYIKIRTQLSGQNSNHFSIYLFKMVYE